MQLTAAQVVALLTSASSYLGPALTAAGKTAAAETLASFAAFVAQNEQLAAMIATVITAEWAAIPGEWQAFLQACDNMGKAVAALKAKF